MQSLLVVEFHSFILLIYIYIYIYIYIENKDIHFLTFFRVRGRAEGVYEKPADYLDLSAEIDVNNVNSRTQEDECEQL